MEKWQQYRLEIDQSSMIGQTIIDQSKKIERYKREIDRINPAILQGTNDIGIDLHKGVSEVIVSQNQVSDNIYKLFKNLNKGKTEENRNDINTILFNLERKKILDKNDKIKQDWLDSNANYKQLVSSVAAANLDKSTNQQLSEDLQKKIEVLSAKKGEIQVGSVPLLKLDPTKNVGHHVFVISATIAVTFFLILLAMILIRWFA